MLEGRRGGPYPGGSIGSHNGRKVLESVGWPADTQAEKYICLGDNFVAMTLLSYMEYPSVFSA